MINRNHPKVIHRLVSNLEESTIVIPMAANVQAPLGPESSAGIVMINFVSHIYMYMGLALRGLPVKTWLILGLCPGSERRHYIVMTSLIGWLQA